MTTPITLAAGQVWTPAAPSRAKARRIDGVSKREVAYSTGGRKPLTSRYGFETWIRRHKATCGAGVVP